MDIQPHEHSYKIKIFLKKAALCWCSECGALQVARAIHKEEYQEATFGDDWIIPGAQDNDEAFKKIASIVN